MTCVCSSMEQEVAGREWEREREREREKKVASFCGSLATGSLLLDRSIQTWSYGGWFWYWVWSSWHYWLDRLSTTTSFRRCEFLQSTLMLRMVLQFSNLYSKCIVKPHLPIQSRFEKWIVNDRLWPWSSTLGFDASDGATVLKSLFKMDFGPHSPHSVSVWKQDRKW